MKASLGSVDFITSLCRSEDASKRIKEAVDASSYGTDFVRAALSVNEKVRFHFKGMKEKGHTRGCWQLKL